MTKRTTKKKPSKAPVDTKHAPSGRDAEQTRKALLASARREFAKKGYEGVGVRDIAAGAGVTAMLINRYFGSKEQLFAEVVADTMASPTILTPKFIEAGCPSSVMARALVEITKAEATPLEGFLMMLRSAGSERAAEIGREQIQAHYQTTLAKALRGPEAEERAAILLSLVAGVQMMRQALKLQALTGADPAVLEKVLERALDALLQPPAL